MTAQPRQHDLHDELSCGGRHGDGDGMGEGKDVEFNASRQKKSFHRLLQLLKNVSRRLNIVNSLTSDLRFVFTETTRQAEPLD